MIVSKIYETKNNDLTAVVFENGEYSNFIYQPELVALDSEGLIDEAKYGFPNAFPYEGDISEGDTVYYMARTKKRKVYWLQK